MTPGTRYLRHLVRIFCSSLSQTGSIPATARESNVSLYVVKRCLIQAERIGLLESSYVNQAIASRATFRRAVRYLFRPVGKRDQNCSASARGYGFVDISYDQALKLKQAHSLYEELKTLQAVADKLRVTRERVRQLLAKGTAAGLFEYEVTNKRRQRQLEQELDKRTLARELSELNYSEIARKHHVAVGAIVKLCEKYGLMTQELKRERSQRQTLIEYMQMADQLGLHPSTSDMERAGYRKLSVRISRLWGGFEKFRKAYDIPFVKKPVTWLHKMSPADSEARSRTLQQILEAIGGRPGIGMTELASSIGSPYGTVSNQVRQQVKLGTIKYIPRRRIGEPAKLYLMSVGKNSHDELSNRKTAEASQVKA